MMSREAKQGRPLSAGLELPRTGAIVDGMISPLRSLSVCLALAMCALEARSFAADEARPAVTPEPPKKPAVTKIGETTYRLGEITFDAKSREVRIPAVMNLREGGPTEYLLVHETGKVHESLLTTRVRAMDLQVVLKLLRYRSGEGDLFDTFLPAEEQRRKIEAGEKKERGDALSIMAIWEKDGQTREHPAADWVLDAESGKSMTDGSWILTGSHVSDGAFLADLEGSLIAIYLDQIALLNMGRKGAENDERWGANAATTPEVGQKITLVLRPAK